MEVISQRNPKCRRSGGHSLECLQNRASPVGEYPMVAVRIVLISVALCLARMQRRNRNSRLFILSEKIGSVDLLIAWSCVGNSLHQRVEFMFKNLSGSVGPADMKRTVRRRSGLDKNVCSASFFLDVETYVRCISPR